MRRAKVKSIELLLLKRYKGLIKKSKELRHTNRNKSEELMKQAAEVLLSLNKMRQRRFIN